MKKQPTIRNIKDTLHSVSISFLRFAVGRAAIVVVSVVVAARLRS